LSKKKKKDTSGKIDVDLAVASDMNFREYGFIKLLTADSFVAEQWSIVTWGRQGQVGPALSGPYPAIRVSSLLTVYIPAATPGLLHIKDSTKDNESLLVDDQPGDMKL